MAPLLTRSSLAVAPCPTRARVRRALGGMWLAALCACSRQGGMPPPPPVEARATAAALPPTDAGRPTLTVAELLRERPTEGAFVIEGFITRVQACPPCPEGAECKPCMPDHVVVSDQASPLDSYSNLGPRDVIVFVPSRTDLDAMRVGQRRRLTVRITREHTTDLPLHDLELVELGPLA